MSAIRFFRDPLGRQIAYALHGQGTPLVCPCWWVSHVEEDWSHPRFRAFFSALGEEHAVVRYDRAGAGLSDRAPLSTSLEDELVTFEALVDELALERVSLLGVSCGGPIAVAYAARRPDRVQSLVFYGSYLRGADLATREVAEAMTTLVRASWGLGSRALTDVFLPEASAEEAHEFTRRQRSAADRESAAQLLELTYRLDASSLVSAVHAPALVLHRQSERAVPFEAGRRLAGSIAGARFVPLEGRAHPPWEGDDQVARAILAFLRGESGVPAPIAAACALDRQNRALVVDGLVQKLTRLEWGVMQYLADRPKQLVTRDELLRDVWGQAYGGSNVVDAVIRSLRKKLGRHQGAIETVTGHGYRFVGFAS